MNIQQINSNSFKGYDARPLKGFLMNGNPFNIAKEMQSIGIKEGFKIFSSTKEFCSEVIPTYQKDTKGIWAQDLWTIMAGKLFAFQVDGKTRAIKNKFKLKFDFSETVTRRTPKYLEINKKISESLDDPEEFKNRVCLYRDTLNKILQEAHIPGGNLYIVKNGNQDEILVGENELEKYDIDEIELMYKVSKVTPIPQMDEHIDLFLRPLKDKKILVADDTLTLEVLLNGYKKASDYIQTLSKNEQKEYQNIIKNFLSVIKDFELAIRSNILPVEEDVIVTLEDAGYEVLRVPGRLYDTLASFDNCLLQHLCNYMNANVFENESGELVYITNKSPIDDILGLTPEISKKIGFSFEDAFIKSISPYIKPEHIYFIEGESGFVKNKMLTMFQGGIHCACCEVPNEES